MAEEQDKKRTPGLRGAARRVLQDGGLRRTNELLEGMLESSDRVKSEAVRLLGREFRSYLDALGLDHAVLHLLTNYSLEVKASFRLKPLDGVDPHPPDEPRPVREKAPREEPPPPPPPPSPPSPPTEAFVPAEED